MISGGLSKNPVSGAGSKLKSKINSSINQITPLFERFDDSKNCGVKLFLEAFGM